MYAEYIHKKIEPSAAEVQSTGRKVVKGKRLMYRSEFIHALFGSPLLLQRRLENARYTMFNDLNTDVILEIFRHYVAIQVDGAFILTLVSTYCRDLVLASPELWRWIAIEERSFDWIEKFGVSSRLAGTLSLLVIVRLPVIDWRPIVNCVARCHHIFLEIPDYMAGRDVSEGTKELRSNIQHSCEIHWYRAGEELLKEDREPISTPMPDVVQVSLDADGSEYPNYHLYAQTRSIDLVEHEDDYTPLQLLKVYCVLDIMRNMPNLHTLVISHHSIDPISSDIDLPMATMAQLQDFTIQNVDYERNGSLIFLLESIKSPSLQSFFLSGMYQDVLTAACSTGLIGRPPNVILKLESSRDPDEILEIEAVPYGLRFIVSLDLEIDNVLVALPDQETLVENFHRFLMVCDGINTIHWRPAYESYQRYAHKGPQCLLECVHHVSRSNPADPISANATSGRIKGMKCSIFSAVDEWVLLSGPYQWRELDIEPYPLPGPSQILLNIQISCLTTLMVTPFLLLLFLSQNIFPALHSIQLHWPVEDPSIPTTEKELNYFDIEITNWFRRHGTYFPALRTFGLSWFPNLRKLRRMLYSICINLKGDQSFTLKLPAYPHPSIQRALVVALEGVDDRGKNEIPTRASFEQYEQLPDDSRFSKAGVKPCYFCFCSRVQCEYTETKRDVHSICGIHSRANLVSITKDTLVNAE